MGLLADPGCFRAFLRAWPGLSRDFVLLWPVVFVLWRGLLVGVVGTLDEVCSLF